MAAKRVFISFDFDDDKHLRFLLSAWNANHSFDFDIIDRTPSEIQSNNIPVIKANLTKKIKSASHTLVLVGENANKRHPKWREICYRNWINFEVARSKEYGKKLVAVRIKYHYKYPEELKDSDAVPVNSFNPYDIMYALNRA